MLNEREISILGELRSGYSCFDTEERPYYDALSEGIKALRLSQEPKAGEWQQDLDGTYLCSECGSGFKDQPTLMGKPMFLWCPLCGAKMEGSDKE